MDHETDVGLEMIFGSDGKLTINQCQSIAKELAMKNKECRFNLCGPLGSKPAKWLDPHLGFFKLDESDGFIRVCDVEFAGVWCTGVMPPECSDSQMNSERTGKET